MRKFLLPLVFVTGVASAATYTFTCTTDGTIPAITPPPTPTPVPPPPPPPPSPCTKPTTYVDIDFVNARGANNWIDQSRDQWTVIKFTTDANPRKGSLEFGGGTFGQLVNKTYSISSTTMCDWKTSPVFGVASSSASLPYNINSTGGYPLKPNTTYYLSVKNETSSGGEDSCPAGVKCAFLFVLY